MAVDRPIEQETAPGSMPGPAPRDASRPSAVGATTGAATATGARPVPTTMQQLQRLWWIVVVVTLLAGGLAYFSTASQSTTYTGRASLIVSSNNRSPDQDAVLVQGYVDYFNDPAYQSQLEDEAGVEDVSLEARAAAASPILIVESTADSGSVAQSSAAAVAAAFQSDINAVRDQEQQAAIDQLEDRIDAVTEAGGADAPTSVAALQDQIAQLEADRTNRLQELQFDGGVSTNSPAVVNNVGLGVVGGFILGTLLALAVGRLTIGRRRTTVR